MWSFGSFVTKDRARELYGQNSEFAHSRINLEEQVEKMFLECGVNGFVFISVISFYVCDRDGCHRSLCGSE
jgi:hypothetical protein